MNYYAMSAFFNGLVTLFLVYYVFLRNSRNPLNKSFLYFGLSVAGWSILCSFWAWAQDPETAEFFARAHMTSCVFVPVTYLHFIATYTGNYPKYRRLIWGCYSLSAFYAVACHTNLMIVGVSPISIFSYWPDPGPLLASHVLYYTIIVALAFFLLAQMAYHSAGIERKKAIWLFAVFAIGFAGGSINWFLWFDIPVIPITNHFVGVTFLLLTYVMIQYGIMDEDPLMELIRSNRIFNAGILMASMNHELRNPLYVIKGLSEAYLTDEQAQEEDAVDVVNRTARQAERAIGIMQQFSHFVKPPRNETAEHLTNPAHCLAEVCNLVRHQVNVKKIQFETVIPDGLQPLAMPKLHFEEVMLNLILNACQAVPDEGKVRIEFIQKADFLTATISDSGTGIDKEISKDLFQPFKSSKTSGLGLGLYITKQLVERNNGTIDCKSSNAGTLFSLKIPCQTLVSA